MKDIVTEHDNTNIPSDIYSLRYIVPMFIPYAGVPTYSIEYDFLLSAVLLNDLRNLYKKALKFEADFWELNGLGSLKKLAEVCPDHHDKIFLKDQSSYNIDLIKKLYADDYDFLINTKLNEISIEEFKQRYKRIIEQLNYSIGRLASRRELINNYISARDTNDEEKLTLYRPIIEIYEMENKDYSNINKENISEKENTPPKIEEKVASSRTNDYIDERIQCIKSRDIIIEFFDSLRISHIRAYEPDELELLIDNHFKFSADKGSPISKYSNEELIVWMKYDRVLIHLIQELINRKFIEYIYDEYHILIEKHFYNWRKKENYYKDKVRENGNRFQNERNKRAEEGKEEPNWCQVINKILDKF